MPQLTIDVDFDDFDFVDLLHFVDSKANDLRYAGMIAEWCEKIANTQEAGVLRKLKNENTALYTEIVALKCANKELEWKLECHK